MAETQSPRVSFRCKCGTKLKAPVSAAGRKGKCPKCKNVFTVPSAAPAAGKKPPEPAIADTGDSLLEELARQESSAAATQRPDSAQLSTACPHCGTAMKAGAVLCVSCGYNSKTGRTAKVARTQPSALVSLAKQLAARVGPFGLGCLLSVIGAGIGAALWFGVVIITDYEIGWIAWGLGGLAGLGMKLGYRTENTRAGIIAAGIAIAGIVFAKATVFGFAVYVVVTGNTNDSDFQREYVKGKLVEESFVKQDIYSDEEREERWESEYEGANTTVAQMSDDQVRRRWQTFRDEDQRIEEGYSQSGLQRLRLAGHYSQRRAKELGLSHDDERRNEIYDEELERVRSLSESELRDAKAEREAWDEGTRWSDEAYVRTHLIYQLIDIAVAQQHPDIADEEESWEPTATEWKEMYEAARVEAEGMTPATRLTRSKEIEDADETEMKRFRLVWHRTEQQIMDMGLMYGDERRETLRDEEKEDVAGLSTEQLDAAITELDEWEADGKWADADYVDNHLIYQHADREIEQRRSTMEDESDGYWQPSAGEWEEIYQVAVAEVEEIPESDRARRSQEMEAEQTRRWEQEANEAVFQESKEATRDLVAAFFSYAFGWMDCLFIGFAVMTAFRIASGSGSDE